MKKILALLLALVMALGCVGAFAEEPAAEEPALAIPAIPAFTMAWETHVDVETFAALLPALGADESALSIVQTILPLLADTNGKIVFADNGLQFDLGLKGETILTVAGEKVEGGYALASDILPSYVITLADETIEALIEQYTAQAQEALAKVDMETLVQNVTGYAMEFVSTCSGAFAFGEVEMGEFAFEDVDLTFNCRMPITLDMETIKGAAEKLVADIRNDEAVGSLINTLNDMGVSVNLADETEFIIPEVTVYAYSNVDEEGNSVDGITLVDVDVAAEGENVCVKVVVNGESVTVYVSIPSQETYMSVSFAGNEEGFAVSVAMDAQGMQVAENVTTTLGDEIVTNSELYFMGMETPIETQTTAFCMGGERDFAVLDENKTACAVEQLMADTEGQAVSALLADVMSNGLGNLIAKVSQIMPDEAVNVMNLFYGPAPVEQVEAVEGAAE